MTLEYREIGNFTFIHFLIVLDAAVSNNTAALILDSAEVSSFENMYLN